MNLVQKSKKENGQNKAKFINQFEGILSKVQTVLETSRLEIEGRQEDGQKTCDTHQYKMPDESGKHQTETDKFGAMVNISSPVELSKNFLIELEEIFEHECSEGKRLPPSLLSPNPDYLVADQVYKKLSSEVI